MTTKGIASGVTAAIPKRYTTSERLPPGTIHWIALGERVPGRPRLERLKREKD